MIILDTTTKSLEVKLGGAVTTNQLPWIASYAELNTTTFAVTAMASTDGQSNNTTAVTVVSAPSSGRARKIALFSIHNQDTVSATVTLQVNNNSTLRVLCDAVVPSEATLQYVDGEGFRVVNTAGELMVTTTSGAPSDADYLVKTADTGLSAERVVTDSTSITADWATSAQVAFKRAALTGVVVAAANANATTFMSGLRWSFPLGGSREYGLLAASATAVPSYLDVVLNGSLYSGWTIQARVDVRTTDALTSVTPRVQNITDATTAGTGAASTGITEDYSGVNQSQTIALTLAAGVKTYRLQLTPGNADTDVFGIGVLELIAP